MTSTSPTIDPGLADEPAAAPVGVPPTVPSPHDPTDDAAPPAITDELTSLSRPAAAADEAKPVAAAPSTHRADSRPWGGQAPPTEFPNTGQPLGATWVTGSHLGPASSAVGGQLQLTFPVLGAVRYSDGWGNPRGEHGERQHEGTDLLGVTGQPLRAVFDGVVTRRQLEDRGISGAVITITRDDGLRANYFHLNTDDLVDGRNDAAPASWRIPTAVQLGTRVNAGQIIGFMGDSGNAAGVPHLHFELRTPDGVPFNPYPALAAAEARERCTEAFGPWANVGAMPDAPVLPVVGVAAGGATWQVTARGEVVAIGGAAATVGDGCARSQLVP